MIDSIDQAEERLVQQADEWADLLSNYGSEIEDLRRIAHTYADEPVKMAERLDEVKDAFDAIGQGAMGIASHIDALADRIAELAEEEPVVEEVASCTPRDGFQLPSLTQSEQTLMTLLRFPSQGQVDRTDQVTVSAAATLERKGYLIVQWDEFGRPAALQISQVGMLFVPPIR